MSNANKIASKWFVRLELLNKRLSGAIVSSIFCFLAGILIASVYLHGKDARTFVMWQRWYSPAVGLACGYGYTNLPSIPGSQLENFLDAKVDTFDCSKVLSPSKYPPVVSGSDCKYLIGLVGLLWHVVGPSWHSVKFVIGFIYGLMALAAFLLARTIINTWLSLAVTLLYVSDPGTMELMTRLRDLGKAPFILLACAALLWLIGTHSRKWLGIAFLSGALIGIGYGFRPDIVMLLPLGILFIVVLVPKQIRWYKRVFASVVFISAFSASVIPISLSSSTTNKSALAHAVILGLSHLSDYDIGVHPGSYSWGINHADNAVVETVNAFSALAFPHLRHIVFMAPEYEKAGLSYLFQILRVFPGDMAIRVEASAVGLINETIMNVFRLSNSHAPTGLFLIGLVFLATAGFFCVGFSNLRKGIGLGVMFAYLTAIMALQFEHRHHFYMAVFVLISLAALIQFFLVSRFYRQPKSLFIIAGGSGLLMIGMVIIINALQQTQSLWVEPRLAQFISAPRNLLTPIIQHNGMTVATFPQLDGNMPSGEISLDPKSPLPAYPLVMTVDRSRCGSTFRYFRVDYNTLDFLDYTFWLQPYPRDQFGIWSEQYVLPNISALGDVIQITVPLYRDGAALRAIELSPGMASCVIKWERLYSKDPLFDLMNWVVDKAGHLIPYRIELDKPRPVVNGQ